MISRLAFLPLLMILAVCAPAQQGEGAHLTLAVQTAPQPPQPPPVSNLLEVKRIFVAQLSGGPQADALRDLIISSLNEAALNGAKLFVLTENEDRADATLKGSADDHTFEDTFDTNDSVNTRSNASTYSGGSSTSTLSRTSRSGGALGSGISENDSRHIKERKHEAFAAVRLCNRDGDVLWSTSQESLGAKFRGASADVAAKVARQLTLDVERARRGAVPSALPSAVPASIPAATQPPVQAANSGTK
jgi:hypothetical protein